MVVEGLLVPFILACRAHAGFPILQPTRHLTGSLYLLMTPSHLCSRPVGAVLIALLLQLTSLLVTRGHKQTNKNPPPPLFLPIQCKQIYFSYSSTGYRSSSRPPGLWFPASARPACAGVPTLGHLLIRLSGLH